MTKIRASARAALPDPAQSHRKRAPGQTLGETDKTLFSTLTMDPQSLHLNAAFSASAEFGERLVNSLLTTSVLVGLSVGHLTQATTNLGFRDTKVPAPGRHSDTTYGERVGTEKRLSTSRPGQGSSRSSTWPAISTARSWQSSSGPR